VVLRLVLLALVVIVIRRGLYVRPVGATVERPSAIKGKVYVRHMASMGDVRVVTNAAGTTISTDTGGSVDMEVNGQRIALTLKPNESRFIPR